jgi:pimeloyl-ACP methyl ester carboxylesterase
MPWTETTRPHHVSTRSAVEGFDVNELFDKIDVPTLVIHARDDGVQPLEQAYRLAARIPKAQFLVIKSRNHMILPHGKGVAHLLR